MTTTDGRVDDSRSYRGRVNDADTTAAAPVAGADGRAERRESLLDAAERCIRRDGPDVSMAAIAAEAGITKPILYAHFGDKAGLADALGQRYSAELITAFMSVGSTSDHPRDLVARGVDAWIGFISDEPELYRFLTRGPFAKPDRLNAHRVASDIGGGLGDLIAALLTEAGRPTDPSTPWALGIIGMVHMTAEWWLDDTTMSRAQIVDYTTRLLWNGLSGEVLGETGR